MYKLLKYTGHEETSALYFHFLGIIEVVCSNTVAVFLQYCLFFPFKHFFVYLPYLESYCTYYYNFYGGVIQLLL